MSVLEKIKSSLKEIEDQKKAMVATLQKEFSPMFKPLFEKNTKVKSIGWAQYTPYFNDGEECTFSANTDYVYVNGENQDDIDALSDSKYLTVTDENRDGCIEFTKEKGYTWITNEIGTKSYIKNVDFDAELETQIDEFKSVLSEIPDEFLKDLFGDHVLVTVTADGVSTEEYEHD